MMLEIVARFPVLPNTLVKPLPSCQDDSVRWFAPDGSPVAGILAQDEARPKEVFGFLHARGVATKV